MDFKELKTKSEKELQNLLASERSRLLELRFKDSSKQLKNVRQIRVIRNTIAQVLTLINSKRSK